MKRTTVGRHILTMGLGAMLLASCGSEGVVPPPRGGPFVPPPIETTPIGTPTTSALCATARSSEHLRTRADVMATGMSGGGGGGPKIMKTVDLYARFRASCGGCHVEASNGGRHIDDNVQSFARTFDATWLSFVKSDDPDKFMPPPPLGMPFSTRPSTDPIAQLVGYLEIWLAAGRPAEMFTIGGDEAPTTTAKTANYMFTPDTGANLTNLGHCIPSKDEVAISTSGEMESLDTFFAGAEKLPDSLSDTDLTSLDAETLAATGVIAFVPTYPLYSDGSGKLRHIRVPKGQTVKFDKAKQTFSIPPNTRFYKTFLRKVIDSSGTESHRKIETRLIVARPDRTLPDGTVQQTALFGTYLWNEEETSATLANLPYRDGTPFSDQVLTYVTNELIYDSVVDSIGTGAQFEAKLAAALKKQPGLEEHYAVPGRIRCVQCHMGSPTNNFVLGFFPLQIARRPTGTGGTYEPTGEDELNQLQRLIDYGLITGITSPADVLSLETSQGTRKPRTDGELAAQAYMIGNCAHCHNPAGFPSITKPELKTVLDFLPGNNGGVFEFPLDRMSPLRARGAGGDIPFPYITPSLRDYPVVDTELSRVDNGVPLESLDAPKTWTPKFLTESAGGDNTKTSVPGIAECGRSPKGKEEILLAHCGGKMSGPAYVPAPWRSLIYRNVDAPFPYFDDFTPFPRMPMHSPGFDCRAPRIFGDWMVGLPARRIVNIPPDLRDGTPRSEDRLPVREKPGGDTYDSSPQPYAGVSPTDPNYARYVAEAKERLAEYHAGVRYDYCEDILGAGIFDPIPQYRPGYRPDFQRFVYLGEAPALRDPRSSDPKVTLPQLGVPYHSHWFNYDPTEPPTWSPRRTAWSKILGVNGPPEPDIGLPVGVDRLDEFEEKSRRFVVQAVNESTLTDQLSSYALGKVPYGLWQANPSCEQKLQGEKRVADFDGKRPPWMDKANPPANAPVYMMSPGAAIYQHVCINCHGPKADGKGLQADLLAAASEGDARPADFRNGLFGPIATPGANLMPEFGADGRTATLWGARYMAWMALGGTLKKIPHAIIHQVQSTRILGQRRDNTSRLPGAGAVSGNMLNLAAGLCAVVLPRPAPAEGSVYHENNKEFPVDASPMNYPPYNDPKSPFIDVNGDKAMWLDLCARFNRPVVRVYNLVETDPSNPKVVLQGFYYGENYPADAEVLDHERIVRMGVPSIGGSSPNYYPACLTRPADAAAVALLDSSPVRTAMHMPYCPAGFLVDANVMWRGNGPETSEDERNEYEVNTRVWELRGAVNAGMAVFTHLRSGGQEQAGPSYNQCQLLK